MEKTFKQQVFLLLRILPEIAKEKDFALHGGTAINLFYHNLPRLSVDIDLTWIPYGNREDDLKKITSRLNELRLRIRQHIPGLTVREPLSVADELKIYCSQGGTLVKVEVNTINRGVYGELVTRELSPKAQEVFQSYCEVQTVSRGQLFGGKLVAALDRQHPRDLFDIRQMMEDPGYTDDIHQGFLFCLLSSKRPLHEIFQPGLIDQRAVLESQFSGMTDEAFTYEMFEAERGRTLKQVMSRLNAQEKTFLLSFAAGDPHWLADDLSIFPGIKWKLMNIRKLKKTNKTKFLEQVKQLDEIFK